MKHVLLTGGSTGIGAAILSKLALTREKYLISVIGRTRPQVEAELEFSSIDLSNSNFAYNEIDVFLNIRPPVDILINNAGVGYFAPIEEISVEAWSRVISVNLSTVYYLTSKLLPHMKFQNFGRIINISSDADHIGFSGAAAYCASKFGLAGLSEAVRKELVGYNVTVTTVSPGRVDTCFNSKIPGDRPLSLRPESVAALVMSIADSAESWHIENIRLKSPYE